MNYNELEPFKASEVNQGEGWIVDLSPKHEVNPDCFWRFPARSDAVNFIRFMKDGYTPREAMHKTYQIV
jgi:hypothetical protein